GRQPELLGGENLVRDHAKDAAAALAIHVQVRAEPRKAGNLVREVGVVPLRKLMTVLLGSNRIEQPDDAVGVERRRRLIERLHYAILTNERRHADRHMEVRG